MSVQYVLSGLLYKHAESLLIIYLQKNSILFGQTQFFPKAALPFLGSGMTLAYLQSGGQTLSSMLRYDFMNLISLATYIKMVSHTDLFQLSSLLSSPPPGFACFPQCIYPCVSCLSVPVRLVCPSLPAVFPFSCFCLFSFC
jgi:hypothetical protein